MQLNCPLCCGEKFSSHETLRYHLLSMTVNLYCPACNQLCDGILQLVQHLETQCGHNEVNSNDNPDTIKFKLQNGDIFREFISTEEDYGTNNIDVELQEDNLVLDSDSTIIVQAEQNENKVEQNEVNEIYSCSSCGVHFTSVMEHIQQYHDGQEVVVEMSNVTQNSEENNEVNNEILNETNVEATETLKNNYLDDDTTDSEDLDNEIPSPQILNTLKQEECVDKDGRIYTRKVVQIEKFWDDSSSIQTTNKTNRRQAICEAYITAEDGTLIRAAHKDNLIPKDKIVKYYTCSVCKVQFSKLSLFNKHACDPERAGDYKCSKCDVSFNNSKSLCAHMKVHKIIKLEPNSSVAPFLCNKCDTIFPTNKSLRLHQRMHEPIKVKEIEAPVEYGITGPVEIEANKPREMFICPVCNKTYDKGYQAIHMAAHSGEDDYHCDICNRKFFTHDNLEMHMRVHNSGKPYNCTYCKNSYDTNEALIEHSEVHTKDRPYSCGYCGRKFSRPHEKVKHERIHTGEKPHECKICGKTFRVSYCLTLHMRTHTGARPYVCKHCGKRFKAHSVYNHHLLTHSDQRNYKCPYCPKAFKTGVQLAGHKNSHTKPFSCTECNRPFASLYAVRSHMESHKRENNLKFSCYMCGASYARNFALRDHVKEVHTNVSILSTEDTNNIMDTEQVKIEDIESFKSPTDTEILQNDPEIILSTLKNDSADEDL